ncbi:core-2/I-Branching enzyme [Aquimarina sp. MAR_2010_214]|uniref:beta-1,6-N-acetylglucosaminyltransferase n=1 Tax=Aquimarina sp. MAR_2010_214 TaxID=1250026 RepID=UPI000C6FDC6C|nr:beta-1,6-N-acetylglucosaminyltransferase [Aquimarina sp. MAR_2010_214]PKV48053.1 core-2/I-Branching enzyme [Aquimarina sp. MAR_2010_214]
MTQELGITKKQSFHFNIPKKKPKIAYFILVHRFPGQFTRLFKAIYHPENHYLIQIDQEVDINIEKGVKTFLEDYSSVYLLKSENVERGGYSTVQSQINGMKYLLNRCLKWDFFINLSDQDFPLKSQDFIFDFLRRNKEKNFIKIANQIKKKSDTLNRIENHFHEIGIGFSGIPYKRSFMKNVTWYVGGQWMILTRACCEFICHSPEVKKFEDFYRKILIADKSFFQTALMNTSFKETIINDDKRAVVRIVDSNIKLKPKTLTRADIDFLIQGDNLFARKFDERVDESILNILEEALDTNQITNNSNSIDFNLISTLTIDAKKSDLLDPETIINPSIQLPKPLLNGSK